MSSSDIRLPEVAVILVGGFGTRLSEETTKVPKPLVEIGGRPILWHIMKFYSHFGIKKFVLCAGYKQHLIKSYFEKVGFSIENIFGDYHLNSFNSKISNRLIVVAK